MRGLKRLLGLTKEQINKKQKLKKQGKKSLGCISIFLIIFAIAFSIGILANFYEKFLTYPLKSKIIIISIFSVIIIGIFSFYIYKTMRSIKLKIEIENDMISKYPNFTENIKNKTNSIGMPIELVSYLIGSPNDIKEQVLKDKIKKSGFYFPYRTQKNTINYKKRIDFENDILVGWKDL